MLIFFIKDQKPDLQPHTPELQKLLENVMTFLNPSQIREMAQKTKDLTMKYFKTVGVEIAKHMCNQLDSILTTYNLIENKNEI